MAAEKTQKPASLVVYSDDWGRHPSSCQHLIRQLLPKYKVLWVNTIGTRAPRLDLATLRRVGEKLKQWMSRTPVPEETANQNAETSSGHYNLTVINPKMWPWFGRSHDRRLNAWAVSRQLNSLIRQLPQPVTAVTTLPITADLPGLLPVKKWVYYCVDDFSQWPGLDGNTLRRMDEAMIQRADDIIAVSEHLQRMIANHGRQSSLLTHGVDLNHWISPATESAKPVFQFPNDVQGRTAVFWGVVDRRLDVDMLTVLSQKMENDSIVLIGPQQDPDERILNLPNVRTLGPQPFAMLPAVAQAADVLIMPYADLPVTRAMQPLKMKEYMATGRPVVVSSLPAVKDWHDCLDVTCTAEEFAERVLQRMGQPLPALQQQARQRLRQEGWDAKAEILEHRLKIEQPVTAELRT